MMRLIVVRAKKMSSNVFLATVTQPLAASRRKDDTVSAISSCHCLPMWFHALVIIGFGGDVRHLLRDQATSPPTLAT